MSIEKLKDSIERYNGLYIASSILMIVVGVMAIVLPLAAGIGVAIFVSWLIFLIGVAHLAYAFAARSASGAVWRVLLGILYIVGGGYLAFHPVVSLASLTLVLGAIFFAEGIMLIVTYFSTRKLPGSGWTLIDGIVTLILSLMIGLGWPSTSAWAIGTIVGINFLFSGFTRLGHASAARKLLTATA
jgi:uncharacterized membrane protein HdeD (DUF308 family)